MIFFSNAEGAITKVVPSFITQGSSGASELIFVAPFSGEATVAFHLPNGEDVPEARMTETSLEGVVDGVNLYAYRLLLDGNVTKYSGTVELQFRLYMPTSVLACSATSFTVQRGTPTVLPDEPTPSIYQEILHHLAEITGKSLNYYPLDNIESEAVSYEENGFKDAPAIYKGFSKTIDNVQYVGDLFVFAQTSQGTRTQTELLICPEVVFQRKVILSVTGTFCTVTELGEFHQATLKSGESVKALSNDLTATKVKVEASVKSITLNSTTGVLTVTKTNGTTVLIDLPIERLIQSGAYDAATEEIVLVLDDDNEIRVPVASLITEWSGDNETIDSYTDADGNRHFRLKPSYKTNLEERAIPSGGNKYNVLRKASADDYDAEWTDTLNASAIYTADDWQEIFSCGGFEDVDKDVYYRGFGGRDLITSTDGNTKLYDSAGNVAIDIFESNTDIYGSNGDGDIRLHGAFFDLLINDHDALIVDADGWVDMCSRGGGVKWYQTFHTETEETNITATNVASPSMTNGFFISAGNGDDYIKLYKGAESYNTCRAGLFFDNNDAIKLIANNNGGGINLLSDTYSEDTGEGRGLILENAERANGEVKLFNDYCNSIKLEQKNSRTDKFQNRVGFDKKGDLYLETFMSTDLGDSKDGRVYINAADQVSLRGGAYIDDEAKVRYSSYLNVADNSIDVHSGRLINISGTFVNFSIDGISGVRGAQVCVKHDLGISGVIVAQSGTYNDCTYVPMSSLSVNVESIGAGNVSSVCFKTVNSSALVFSLFSNNNTVEAHFRGDDCSGGLFVPLSNKRYVVVIDVSKHYLVGSTKYLEVFADVKAWEL